MTENKEMKELMLNIERQHVTNEINLIFNFNSIAC